MIALLAAAAVFFLVVAVGPVPVSERVGRSLGVLEVPRRRAVSFPSVAPAVIVGGAIGAVTVPAGPVVGAGIGAVVGAIAHRGRSRAALSRAAARLGQELPTVADMCVLYVLSGESVVGAMRRFVTEASGVAASEMAEILARVDAGSGFPEAAREVARSSAHRDAGRLYELLAQAHRSGARLVDALEMFSSDRRAAIERELTAEGGRRALTGYGPILGLMIPTTLLFLMYPTLAGLDALAATP